MRVEYFTAGFFAGVIVFVIGVWAFVAFAERVLEDRCMERHKAPACEYRSEWVPLFPRGE